MFNCAPALFTAGQISHLKPTVTTLSRTSPGRISFHNEYLYWSRQPIFYMKSSSSYRILETEVSNLNTKEALFKYRNSDACSQTPGKCAQADKLEGSKEKVTLQMS